MRLPLVTCVCPKSAPWSTMSYGVVAECEAGARLYDPAAQGRLRPFGLDISPAVYGGDLTKSTVEFSPVYGAYRCCGLSPQLRKPRKLGSAQSIAILQPAVNGRPKITGAIQGGEPPSLEHPRCPTTPSMRTTRSVGLRRAGFTLFELILAVALSAVLLSLIGMAINLYLMRVDADRGRVEEAQLARSVLNMITDDIRSATIYKTQDTSAIAQLMAAGTPFDVDSIDAERKKLSTGSGRGSPGGPAGAIKLQANTGTSKGATSIKSGASSAGSGSASSSSSSTSANGTSDETLPLGLTGADQELYVDVARMPNQDELFGTVTGYTNAPSAASSNPGGSGASASTGEINPPADVKTVHYFVRAGAASHSAETSGSELSPTAQVESPGLVRQEVGRPARLFAEQSGNSDELNAGGVVVAPEVLQIQFRYYDGTQLLETWDMKELQKLPTAIEVTVWLRPMQSSSNAQQELSSTDLMNQSRSYRQVVYLPMAAQSAATTAAASTSNSSSPSPSTGSSDSNKTDPSAPVFGQ